MEKIDNFYKKVNGSYFAFLGVMISIITISISILLYSVDSSFSPFTHWISDLGEGPNYSNYVFNIGLIVIGIILALFYLYLTRFLQKMNGNKIITWFSLIIGMIASMGMIFAGIYPMYTEPFIHFIFAAFYFVGAFLYCLSYGCSELMIKEIPKKYPITGFFVAPIILLFMMLFLLAKANFPISPGLYLIFEWIAHFATMAWIFYQGVFTLKQQQQ